MGNLSTPGSVQKLQTALHAKAKAAPGYRFYALYDKMYREDVLALAYARAVPIGGASGVDGQTFADIEAYGVERWLDELALALRQETYRPQPIRRVYIPKPDGKHRPLGIATLRDRVVQTAAMLVLEPIFEADLPAGAVRLPAGPQCPGGGRRGRSTAVPGHTEVVDADLRGLLRQHPAPRTDEIGGASQSWIGMCCI